MGREEIGIIPKKPPQLSHSPPPLNHRQRWNWRRTSYAAAMFPDENNVMVHDLQKPTFRANTKANDVVVCMPIPNRTSRRA